MCGITGIYAFNNKASKNLSAIETATNLLSLRGPDSGNIFNDSLTALGHRRLSIIDTSSDANQPMYDPSGRYVIVFNGEIFNYRELSDRYLKEVWEKEGAPRTGSDTEILLRLLVRYGTECLNWLSGFFAFAFYDRQTRKLLLARDRYGKKPLVYYRHEDYLAFASEMKALLSFGIPKALDRDTLLLYLQLNYVPPHLSMLQGVSKLAPGCCLEVGPQGIKESRYYELKIRPEAYRQYSYEAAQQELVRLMDESVRERMIADVPLGAFLSGGIDSSVIVALASRHTGHLNTFSVGYKDNPFFDETSYAQLVAKKYNTRHTVFSLSNNDFLEHVHDVLDYLDEPYADSSAIPSYILCRHTRGQVTVSLSGDGGDEVFSGYNKHAAEWQIRQPSIRNSMVRAGLPLWSALPKGHHNKLTNLFRQLHRFAEGAQLSVAERYWRWASMTAEGAAMALLAPQVRQSLAGERIAAEKRHMLRHLDGTDFNEVLLTDMELVLTGDMLVKVDMMSMANSLEVRCPFLDYKVVDFAFGLPEAYKIDGKMKKKILQDAFRSMLPPELYNRPKHGFEIPLLGWMRRELWGLINDDLLSDRFVREQGIFDAGAVAAVKQRLHSRNPGNSHGVLWALIVFQHWWKRYYNQ